MEKKKRLAFFWLESICCSGSTPSSQEEIVDSLRTPPPSCILVLPLITQFTFFFFSRLCVGMNGLSWPYSVILLRDVQNPTLHKYIPKPKDKRLCTISHCKRANTNLNSTKTQNAKNFYHHQEETRRLIFLASIPLKVPTRKRKEKRKVQG